MNSIIVTGRITSDFDVKTTTGNIKHVRFTIASNRTFDGSADFVPIVAWRSQADFVEKYLGKGSLIAIRGRFSSSTYQKDGKSITRYEISAESVESLESKAQAEERKKAQVIKFKEEEKPKIGGEDVPWEMDL